MAQVKVELVSPQEGDNSSHSLLFDLPTPTFESPPHPTKRDDTHLLKTANHSKQLCPVCGDVSSGHHYGIDSCESCKGFFRRVVQQKQQYLCKFEANCFIDKDTRRTCAACRFAKCINLGMLTSSVRENRKRGGCKRRKPGTASPGGVYASPQRTPAAAANHPRPNAFRSPISSCLDVRVPQVAPNNTISPVDTARHREISQFVNNYVKSFSFYLAPSLLPSNLFSPRLDLHPALRQSQGNIPPLFTPSHVSDANRPFNECNVLWALEVAENMSPSISKQSLLACLVNNWLLLTVFDFIIAKTVSLETFSPTEGFGFPNYGKWVEQVTTNGLNAFNSLHSKLEDDESITVTTLNAISDKSQKLSLDVIEISICRVILLLSTSVTSNPAEFLDASDGQLNCMSELETYCNNYPCRHNSLVSPTPSESQSLSSTSSDIFQPTAALLPNPGFHARSSCMYGQGHTHGAAGCVSGGGKRFNDICLFIFDIERFVSDNLAEMGSPSVFTQVIQFCATASQIEEIFQRVTVNRV